MDTYTNAQKLAAVLNHWASPMVTQLMEHNIGALPFVANIENKIRSTGWVTPSWSMTKELTPLMSNVTAIVIEPILANYIAGIPDTSIPNVAHKVVDNAISKGEVTLLDGNVKIDLNDLQELKRYLNYNLPLCETDGYKVILEPTNTETT